MSDITTVWDVARGRGDWAVSGTELESGNDLRTAIYISLFTDRRANVDDVLPDNSDDPRGWACDDTDGGPLLGSRLWLLDRSKQLPDVLNRARDYCHEALQWLIDDDVVARFDIEVEFPQPGMLGIIVTVYQADGTQLPAMLFSYVWRQL